MASRENICYKMLKRHGFLINYTGKSLGNVDPKSKKSETFGQWKMRVLGPKARSVIVYAPIDPAPQTRISTLKKNSGGEHIKKIFEAFGRFKDRMKDEAVAETEEETYELFSTIPKETLRSVVSSFDGTLEPSLEEFFERFLSSKRDDVDTEELLQGLVKGYNGAVRHYRELKEG